MNPTACLFVLGLAVAAVAADGLTPEQKEKVLKISKECQEKSGVTQEVIDKLRHGEYTKDDKTDAHLLCVVKATGVLSEDGKILTDVLKTKLSSVITDQEKVNKLVAECAIQKDAPVDTAKAILKCLKDAKEASGKDIHLI